MTIAAFVLVEKSLANLSIVKGGPSALPETLKKSFFRNFVISLLGTVGLYFIASFIHLDPWHMFTSSIQYLIVFPSYISVLSVYAFANVHDVSWGTKGDNEAAEDSALGVVDRTKSGEVELNFPNNIGNINTAFEDSNVFEILRTALTEEPSKKDAEQVSKDYYASFRTKVLLAWTLSNGLLAAVIVHWTGKAASKGATATVNGYMAFILISVACLTLIRFIGSVTYVFVDWHHNRNSAGHSNVPVVDALPRYHVNSSAAGRSSTAVSQTSIPLTRLGERGSGAEFSSLQAARDGGVSDSEGHTSHSVIIGKETDTNASLNAPSRSITASGMRLRYSKEGDQGPASTG